MAKNYLPFARRVYLTLAASSRQSVLRESFSSGMGNRAFLSDLSVDFVINTNNIAYDYTWTTARVGTQHCLMRIGVFGRPFLTEEFYPVALFNDMSVNEVGVWELPKPYTIFPGERLKARVLYSPGGNVAPLPSEAYDGLWATWPSISFHGIRRDNGRPIVLYDTFPATVDANGVFTNPPLGTPVLLQGERLQCPKECPVDIYSVKQSMCGTLGRDLDASGTGNNIVACQVFSPDGRKWWDNDNWPAVLQPSFVIKNLRGPEWVLEPDETVSVEIENPATSFTNTVMLTLRGQVEVDV